MNTTMSQAFADAKPLRRAPRLTHISHYGHALAVKFSDASLIGRAFSAPVVRVERGRLIQFQIREVSHPDRKFARGVSVVDKNGRLTWSAMEYEEIAPFGHTALPVPCESRAEGGGLTYDFALPPDYEMRAPMQRSTSREPAAVAPADPFLATWERMTKLEDEVNALLAEHPELTVEVAQPRHRGDPRQIRFRRAQP